MNNGFNFFANHFDEIYKLGFFININWNENIYISYNASHAYISSTYYIDVLNCSYYTSKDKPYTFLDMVEVCFDLFYDWYNKNLDKIKSFEKDTSTRSLSVLEDCCLKDVSKQVARELKLTDILSLIDKYKS